MGLFDALRKKQNVRFIGLEDIDSWLEGYVSRHELGTKLGIIKREILSKKSKLNELLDSLEGASPKNTDGLPERSLQVVLSNKKKYVDRIRSFVEDIVLPGNLVEIKFYLETLSEGLALLEEETQKQYFSIRDHFSDETSLLIKKLKELDSVVSSGVGSFEHSSIEKISVLKNLIKEYYLAEEEVKLLRAELDGLNNKRLEEFDKRSKFEEKINKIKESSVYKEFEKLLLRIEEINSKEDEIVSLVKDQFGNIETLFIRSLGKRDKVLSSFDKKLLDSLLKNGEKLAKRIDFALKKADKSSVFVGDLGVSSDKVREYQKHLSDFADERKVLVKRMKNNSASLNIREQEGWINSIDENIAGIERKMEKVESSLERRSLTLAKQKIRKVLKELDPSIDLK